MAVHVTITDPYSGYPRRVGQICSPRGSAECAVRARTDLLKPTVLLYQGRKHIGAAVGRRLHIVVAEAAEEGAEDAAAPLLL